MRASIVIMIALGIRAAIGADTNIEQIVGKGIVIRGESNTLSSNDVPKKFRTRVEDQSADGYTRKGYFRGDEKVLEVEWKTSWTGPMSSVFAATVYDGSNKIGKVMASSDGSINIMQPRITRNDYNLITSVKTNGLVELIFSNDKGYLQIIEINGRDTRLLDDLEYVNSAVLIDEVAKTPVDPVKEGVKQAPQD